MKASITQGHKRVADHAKIRVEPTGMRRVLRKSITERYKRVAVHAKILFGPIRRVLPKNNCWEVHTPIRVAVHAKMLVLSVAWVGGSINYYNVMYQIVISERYNHATSYGNSGSGSARRRLKIWRFYGSSMKISLDFDAIWHLEHSFWDPKSSKFSPAAPIS